VKRIDHMARRKKKNKRDKKRARRPRGPRLPQQGSLPGGITFVSPTGETKMSEVLMEFVEPYDDQWTTEEQLKKLLILAVIAWNAAIYSGSEREQFIQDMVKAVPPELRPEMRAIVEEMIQRKLSYFAGNRRMIVDCQVTMTPTGPHVVVMSTPHTV
jgi:hypothetical protein